MNVGVGDERAFVFFCVFVLGLHPSFTPVVTPVVTQDLDLCSFINTAISRPNRTQ